MRLVICDKLRDDCDLTMSLTDLMKSGMSVYYLTNKIVRDVLGIRLVKLCKNFRYTTSQIFHTSLIKETACTLATN